MILTIGSRVRFDGIEYVVAGYSCGIGREGRSIVVTLKDMSIAETRSLRVADEMPGDIKPGSDLKVDEVDYVCTGLNLVRDNGGRAGTIYAKDPLWAQQTQMADEEQAEFRRLMRKHLDEAE